MKIAIVGATGKVGRQMLTCLDEMGLLEGNKVDLLASERTAGTTIEWKDKTYTVLATTPESFEKGYDFALFSAGGSVSREIAKYAVIAGTTVIDNSSAFRRDPSIPLVVPEINGHLLAGYKGIIANPNCTTIQLVLALHPLRLYRKIKKVVVTTMQSVSGSGYKGIIEMQNQRKGDLANHIYPRQIDLNVIPQIGSFEENLYSEEENKVNFETQKILNDPTINLVATNVRVPVVYGHSESVYVEFESAVDLNEINDILSKAPAVAFSNEYITPAEIGESDLSHISRVRYAGDDRSIFFWNVGHNVRLGAATNAVKILKMMCI